MGTVSPGRHGWVTNVVPPDLAWGEFECPPFGGTVSPGVVWGILWRPESSAAKGDPKSRAYRAIARNEHSCALPSRDSSRHEQTCGTHWHPEALATKRALQRQKRPGETVFTRCPSLRRLARWRMLFLRPPSRLRPGPWAPEARWPRGGPPREWMGVRDYLFENT